jgi:hypothetical protein
MPASSLQHFSNQRIACGKILFTETLQVTYQHVRLQICFDHSLSANSQRLLIFLHACNYSTWCSSINKSKAVPLPPCRRQGEEVGQYFRSVDDNEITFTITQFRILLSIKVSQSHNTSLDALGQRKCSSYWFTTSALDRGVRSASRPGRALLPGKGPPVPIVQQAGWAPEPVWTKVRRKILCLCRGSNLDRPVVQSVVRHYTDSATRLLFLSAITLYF